MFKIGKKLKHVRESLEITQREVNLKTGINSKTLSGYENDVSYPDLETFRKLLLFYGVSADTILELPTAINMEKCNDQEPFCLSEDEKYFIELYRLLPNDLKVEIKGEIKGILRTIKQEHSATKETGFDSKRII